MSFSARDKGDAVTRHIAGAASILVASAVAALTTYLLTKNVHRHKLDKLQRLRQEERTGRIRAEVRLRKALKDSSRDNSTTNDESSRVNGGAVGLATTAPSTMMTIRSIGVVVSPFVKRMGTPRQPQLVPNARGYIQFNVPPSCLDGIQEYSHAWIIFEFHANTNTTATTVDGQASSSSSSIARTKIRPPRAPHKVGQLATRSPHRPNPLGLSLVTIDAWDATTRRLHISSLDLVSGTPVYDVKPFVPWDVPGYVSHPAVVASLFDGAAVVRVPAWVIQEDRLASVQFEDRAAIDLRKCIEAGRLAPLYTTTNQGWEAAQSLLVEILQQDPRSSHRGLKENQRGSADPSQSDYSIILGQCLVSFRVTSSGVTVTKIVGVELDPGATMYAEGIPLLMPYAQQVGREDQVGFD